jgi:ComF family protein
LCNNKYILGTTLLILLIKLLAQASLVLDKIKRILFPPACAFCGVATEEYYSLCTNCWFSVKFIRRNACQSCGSIVQKNTRDTFTTIATQYCSDCIDSGIELIPRQVIASIVYDDFSKKFILRMKNKNDPSLALVFAKFFYEHDFDDLDYIVPVPSHPFRLWQRTYNQAALLALSLKHWFPKCPDVRLYILKRIRYTPKQKWKNAIEREKNVENSIIVPSSMKKYVKGRRIAIIDDVVASQSTLLECKKALKNAGAIEVRCIALAQASVSDVA